MEVISQKKNPVMKREEAWVRIDHAGKPTPPRKDIIADVAKQFKAKDDCVIVDKIFSETGMGASRVKVLVYPKADAVPKAKMEKMKIRMKLLKKGESDKKDQAAAPAAPAEGGEAKPAEAKAEEKPEEKKEEKPAGEEKKDK